MYKCINTQGKEQSGRSITLLSVDEKIWEAILLRVSRLELIIMRDKDESCPFGEGEF